MIEDDEFIIYKQGLCYASVCSSLPLAQVEARMAADPTGIASHWTLSSDPTFRSGEPNPCPCNVFTETHKHYLFSC